MNIFSQMAGSWMRPLRSFFGAALLLGVALTGNAATLYLNANCATNGIYATGYNVSVVQDRIDIDCGTPTSITPADTTAPGTIAFTSSGTGATAGQTNAVTLNVSRSGAGTTAPAASATFTCDVVTSPTGGVYAPSISPTGLLQWTLGGNQTITISSPAFTSPTTGAQITCTLQTASGAGLQGLTTHVVTIARPAAAPAPTSGLPANCRMDDFQKLAGYGPGDQTFDPNGSIRKRIVHPANEIRAYRLLRSSLPVGGATNGKFGGFQVGTYAMAIHLSSKPCDFEQEVTASKFTDFCQIYASGLGQYRTYYLPNDPTLNNPAFGATLEDRIKTLGACMLPEPDEQGYVYINTRLAKVGPINPTSSTCVKGADTLAPTACTHYVFYK